MAPALRMTRSIKEKLPFFLAFLFACASRGIRIPKATAARACCSPFFPLSFCLRRRRHECGYTVSRLIGYSFKPTSVFILHLLTAANIKTPFEDYHYSLLLTLARHPYRQLDISTPGGIRNSTMFAVSDSKYCEGNHALVLSFLFHGSFLSAPSMVVPFLIFMRPPFPTSTIFNDLLCLLHFHLPHHHPRDCCYPYSTTARHLRKDLLLHGDSRVSETKPRKNRIVLLCLPNPCSRDGW